MSIRRRLDRLERAMRGEVDDCGDRFLYIVSLRDSFQGFNMPNIETTEGQIGVLPAIGTEDEARKAVRALVRSSGVPESLFRVCRYRLSAILECGTGHAGGNGKAGAK